jgi:hypothetical protein
MALQGAVKRGKAVVPGRIGTDAAAIVPAVAVARESRNRAWWTSQPRVAALA